MVNPNDGTTVLNTPKSTGACFIAGTLVHTDKGLVPIEKLRVGDMVLSQPEMKGEQGYKRVVNTFSFVDKEVYLLMYATQDKVDQLVATDNHPFWVSDKGWIQAFDLEPGDKLELEGGITASVFCVQRIFRTDTQDVGWVQGKHGRQNDFTGDIVDLSSNAINFGDEGVPNGGLSSMKGDPHLKRRVFNIEVEDFHTYYVGEAGVWVHSTHCNETTADSVTAIDRSITKGGPLAGNTDYHAEFAQQKANKAYVAELTSACFERDTKVHTIDGFCPIEFLSVGALVLSRCEKTGEQGYRRITKTFEHEDRPTVHVEFQIEDYQFEETQFGGLYTTAEHPFWVNGVGWVAASQLQPEQQLEIVDTDLRPEMYRPIGQKLKDYQTDGKRRTARVISVKPSGYRWTVYNIEVEEFHTYFVGFEGVWVHHKTNPPV
jgi:hypothetical protein